MPPLAPADVSWPAAHRTCAASFDPSMDRRMTTIPNPLPTPRLNLLVTVSKLL